MRRLISFVWFFVSIFLAFNWGFDITDSVGGGVVLSIIFYIVLMIGMTLLLYVPEIIVARHRDRISVSAPMAYLRPMSASDKARVAERMARDRRIRENPDSVIDGTSEVIEPPTPVRPRSTNADRIQWPD
ncbi:MAG: hypothetical protein WBP12_02950 [Candidatus Saccharimonas sp.]